MKQSLKYLQIPPDKKILKGFALLEIQHQTTFIQDFILNHWQQLNEDSQAVGLALCNRYNRRIPVLNYGGLLEGLDVLYNEILHIPKEFIIGEQLSKRPRATEESSKRWTARHILGSTSALFHLDGYYFDLADKILRSWKFRDKVITMMKKPDLNLTRVVDYALHDKQITIDNSEIAVSGVIFEILDPMKAIKMYGKQWKNHETDRTKTIIQALKDYKTKSIIDTQDPRIAVSLLAKAKHDDKDIRLKDESIVTKIFPQCREVLFQT